MDLSLLFWLKFDYLFYAIFSWFCCSVILFSYILCFHFLLCSVFTPYYSEIVLYSMAELQKKNEDGITTLFYLQKIYPGSGLYFFPISMSAERNTWILYSVTFSCDPLVISVILLWYVCLTNLEVEISLKMVKCFSPNYLCMSPSSKFHKPRALQLLNGYSTVLQRQNTNSLFGFFLSGTESGTSLRTRCSPNFEGWRYP